jgi:hypothetical protein
MEQNRTTVRIKPDWANSGKTGTHLAFVTDVKGQVWAVVQWDNEDDPDLHKAAGLESFVEVEQCEAGVQGVHTIFFHRCRNKQIKGERAPIFAEPGEKIKVCGVHLRSKFVMRFTSRR